MANKAQLWRELTSEERIVVEVVAKHTKKKKQLDYDGGSDFSNFTQSDKKIQQTIFALLETEEANCKTFVVLSRDEGTYLFVIGRDGKWYATGNIVKDGLPSALKRFARDQVKTKPKKNLLWEVLSWYLFASAPIILIILSNKGEDRPVFVALVWVLWFLGLGAASVAMVYTRASCISTAVWVRLVRCQSRHMLNIRAWRIRRSHILPQLKLLRRKKPRLRVDLLLRL